MKNSAILDMVARQYGWDSRNIAIDFLSMSAEGYKFKVLHNHTCDKHATELTITVKVEYKCK